MVEAPGDRELSLIVDRGLCTVEALILFLDDLTPILYMYFQLNFSRAALA